MLERSKYDIQPVPDMPTNVVFGIPKNLEQRYIDPNRFYVRKELVGLLTTLAAEHPEWQIEAIYRAYGSGGFDDFDVYCKDEKVGEIAYIQGSKYRIECKAIGKQMARRNYRTTRHEREAYKMIKLFAVTPLADLIHRTKNRTEDALRALADDARGELRHAMNQVQGAMLAYMFDNWEAVKDGLIKAGAHMTAIDKLAEKQQHKQEMSRLADRLLDKSVSVLIRDDVYVLTNPMTEDENGKIHDPVNAYYVCNSDTLPPRVRMAIGMLKLVKAGTAIPDVGFRYSDTEFLVKLEES